MQSHILCNEKVTVILEMKHCGNYKFNAEYFPQQRKYPASRGFSLSWRFSFGVYEVVRVACLSRSWFFIPINKPTMRQASHVNDFVNAKSHAKEKTLLAGYNEKYNDF